MDYIFKKLATLYMKVEQWFRDHKYIVFIGVAIFFILAVCNCFMIMVDAKDDEEIIVVVDAGHGGNDPGKVGTAGNLEKDINLEIALKLKAELEEQGIVVILTRDTDTNLATLGATNKKTSDMSNRVELINESNATCLISIHQNAYSDPGIKGAQVFYCSQSEESKKLAETIQGSLIENLDPENHRQIKAGDDYYLLKKTICPSVIIECGFLSCPSEESKLTDEGYQQKLAEAICQAICDIYK